MILELFGKQRKPGIFFFQRRKTHIIQVKSMWETVLVCAILQR